MVADGVTVDSEEIRVGDVLADPGAAVGSRGVVVDHELSLVECAANPVIRPAGVVRVGHVELEDDESVAIGWEIGEVRDFDQPVRGLELYRALNAVADILEVC